MSEAEKAKQPKKSKWALMCEVSAAVDRRRVGKTHNDHRSGAAKRNRDNVSARGDWSRSGGASKDGPSAFPNSTLGGKGNSSLAFKMCPGRGRTQDHRKKS